MHGVIPVRMALSLAWIRKTSKPKIMMKHLRRRKHPLIPTSVDSMPTYTLENNEYLTYSDEDTRQAEKEDANSSSKECGYCCGGKLLDS